MYSSLDLLPSRIQRWVAGGVSALLGLVVICVIPYSHRSLPVVPQFSAINLTVAVLFDTFVSLVFALQYRASGYRPLGVLTFGYSTTAVLALAQGLGFPGIMSERGLFSANPQTFIWMWMAWHAGFALLMIVFAMLRRSPERDRTEPSNAHVWAVVGCGCALGYAVAIVAFRCSLPTLITHTVYTASFRPFEALLIVATIAAIGSMIVATRLRSVLDLWLTVALLGMLGELVLTAFGGARFSAGWYLARILGQATSCAAALTFFAELVVLYTRMSRMAFIDQLTGLGNRRTFDQRIDEALRNSVRTTEPVSLLMLDVDDFKKFNDVYGHFAGDQALRTVAASIRSAARRPLDTAARYGGEEFAVVLPNTDLAGAVKVGERIGAELAAYKIPHKGSRAGPYVTVSIGAATACGNEVDVEGLVQRADAALYDAKAKGRNIVSTGANAPSKMLRATPSEEITA